MSSLGIVSFTTANGPQPELAGYDLGDITRAGTGGKAFWITGYTADPFQIQTTSFFANFAAAGAVVLTWRNLKGSIVSYVDDQGVTWSNMLIRKYKPGPAFYLLATPVTGYPVVVQCDWTLEHIQV